MLVALGVAGCTDPANQDVARDESTGEVTEADEVGVFRLRDGDCLMMPGEGVDGQEISTMEAVPCSDPHDGEVLALLEVAGDAEAAFPGEDALADEAQTRCLVAFEADTGRDFMADPDWDLRWLAPSSESWEVGGDREIVCIVTPLDGEPTTDLAAG